MNNSKKHVKFSPSTLQRAEYRNTISEWQRKHRAVLKELENRIQQQLKEEESSWLDWYSIQEATKCIYLDKLFLSYTELKEYQWLFDMVKERAGINRVNSIYSINK